MPFFTKLISKLDVLDSFEKINICTAYELDGKKIDYFPSSSEEQSRIKPIFEELDLRMELAAAAEFKSNTENDDKFTVPSVLWELSTRRVMITEWVNGIPLSKRDELKKANTDLEELAKRIVQKFLTHALHDGFFHADMHQGNLMRGTKDSLIAMDFGIMGRIDPYTRRVYAEILMGFLNKDYFRVAEVHFEAGYVPIDQDVNVFAQSLRAVAEPIFGMEAHNISMARLLKHLFDVTERFGMEKWVQVLKRINL